MKQGILFFLGGSLILFLAVYSFTRPAVWDDLDFSTTGQIGDTIGGIAAPIIGLIGAVLVYMSFNVQNEANKLQRKALEQEINRNKELREFDILFGLFKEIKEEVENFDFVIHKPGYITGSTGSTPMPPVVIPHKGLDGIAEFILKLRSYAKYDNEEYQLHSSLAQLKYILGSLYDLSIMIEKSTLLNQDKELLKHKVYFYYQAKFEELIISFLKVKFENDDLSSYVKIVHEKLAKKG